jgi:hypothetical protein
MTLHTNVRGPVIVHNAGRLTDIYKMSREGVELTAAVKCVFVRLRVRER